MLRLFTIELYRGLLIASRYPINFVSGLLMTVFSFYGLFLGARYMSGLESFGESLDAIVVGYACWVLVARGFSKTPQHVQSEAATGVLESVFMSRYNKAVLFVTRALAESLIDIVRLLIMVVAIVALTGSNLAYPSTLVLCVVTLILSSAGIGMVAGGLALRLKRVQAMLPAIQLLLMFFTFTPFETWTSPPLSVFAKLAIWLPMVPSVILTRQQMAYAHPFDFELAVIAILNGLAYCAVGSYVFHRMANAAKAKGSVGTY